MRFVGIDLAWSLHHTDRPETGSVALNESGEVLESTYLSTDDSIVEFVLRYTDQEGCIVSIDAPLVVPNETGQRQCEADLQAAGIAAYPANRELFTRTLGGVRGEGLVSRLAEHGFELRAELPQGQPVRALIEVYPRASVRRLWGKIPPYKGSKVKGAVLASGLRRLQTLMLEQLDPPIRWPDPPVPLGPPEVGVLGQLKSRADLLDAALSAWVGYAAWLRGPSQVETFGTAEEGFIVVPRALEAAPATRAPRDRGLSEQERNKALFRRLVDVWNTGNVADLEQLVSPAYIGHRAADGTQDRDREGLKRCIEAVRRELTNIVFAIEEMVAEGEKVATRLTARRAEGGAGASAVMGMNISHFGDGRLVEEWYNWDLDQFRQLNDGGEGSTDQEI